jgi:hypothetical protein
MGHVKQQMAKDNHDKIDIQLIDKYLHSKLLLLGISMLFCIN